MKETKYHNPHVRERLLFGRVGRAGWSFFVEDRTGRVHRVGPHYPTRRALLDNMAEYAATYGMVPT